MKKKMAWFWIIFSFTPFLLWYFTKIYATAIWCGVWIAVWALFIHSKADELTRGLAFIVASVFVATFGRTLIGETESADVLDMVQNVILLISGGVGGNFVAAALLKNQHQDQNSHVKSQKPKSKKQG